ncbi:hypothetical protein BC751_2806 [Cecembia calidifontis]|jgi:hypothetical protein|uniref:Uncharacterized protein n=1 Tax=Cecembia calidifontis TaxID=1187080 RepID=A0A4Q7PBY8_9BACT|nr:hypothetical protein BC751_2806 [Cecembia calidifontis]
MTWVGAKNPLSGVPKTALLKRSFQFTFGFLDQKLPLCLFSIPVFLILDSDLLGIFKLFYQLIKICFGKGALKGSR